MMSEEGGEFPSERPLAEKHEPLFTEGGLEALLGYERFEAKELEAIPRGLLDEEERASAIAEAQASARVKHRIFYNEFMSQVFPESDDDLSKLVIICNESFHKGRTIEISAIKFGIVEETGFVYLHEGMILTPFYQETLLLNDKPMKMSLRRARSLGLDFNMDGGLRVHSTFRCECSLTVEIKAERLNRLFTRIIEAGKREGLIRGGELRFPLKNLSIIASSG